MTNEETKLVNPSHDPSKDRTDMAVDRTVMAADRSLMAWLRTGLSLITFGFTIYKFLQISNQQLIESGKVLGNISNPKIVGLFMIGMGVLCGVFGTIENIGTIKALRGQYQVKRPPYALIMSAIVTLFGLVIFLGIIFKIGGFD